MIAKISEIYENAGLSQQEIEDMPHFLLGEVDFCGSTAFEKLYTYFAFDICEMPYGIAKARDGDPDLWILEQLDYAQS